MGKTYTARVERDGEDHVLILPDELVQDMGFKEGDEILWEREDPKEEGDRPIYSFRRVDR